MTEQNKAEQELRENLIHRFGLMDAEMILLLVREALPELAWEYDYSKEHLSVDFSTLQQSDVEQTIIKVVEEIR